MNNYIIFRFHLIRNVRVIRTHLSLVGITKVTLLIRFLRMHHTCRLITFTRTVSFPVSSCLMVATMHNIQRAHGDTAKQTFTFVKPKHKAFFH